MKGRKHHRAGGGVVDKDEAPREVYAGAGSNVVKEADERKRGGIVKAKKEVEMRGHKAKHRLDRPGRKMGGRVGADKSPLSSAARTSDPDESHDMSADAGDYKHGGHVKKEVSHLAEGGKSDKWIAGMHMKKGALHRELHVPEGETIPAKKLMKAEHSDNPKLAKRARLAETLKSFHH